MLSLKLFIFSQIVFFTIVVRQNNATYYYDMNLNEKIDTSTDCNTIPPALWCSSGEIAVQCGFVDSCSKYLDRSINKPLQITLLYESLCEYCQKYIGDYLHTIVQHPAVKDYVTVKLVPYGNAKRFDVNFLLITFKF